MGCQRHNSNAQTLDNKMINFIQTLYSLLTFSPLTSISYIFALCNIIPLCDYNEGIP